MSQHPSDYNKAFEQIARNFSVSGKKRRNSLDVVEWVIGIIITVAIFSVMYGIGIFILALAAHLQFGTPFPNFWVAVLAGFGFGLTSTLSRAINMWART